MRAPGAGRLSVRLLLLAALASVMVWAKPAPVTAPTAPGAQGVLQISFRNVPGLLYNRDGASSLTITSSAGKREIKLSGEVDVHGSHHWSRLTPLRLAVGESRVKLRTRLYVCDQVAGLCSVRQHEQSVVVMVGGVTKVSLLTGEPLGP